MAEDYIDTLKRRLGIIKQQGINATAYAQGQAANDQLANQAALQEGYNSQLQGDSWGSPTGGKDFGSFMNAIKAQESGGNYRARNPSGASGAYQIMKNNIQPWAREAGLGNVSYQQFMSSPQIQDSVAKYKLQQYYNMYGAAGAAIAWYAGPGAAQRYMQTRRISTKGQGAYPSQYGYVQDILRRMGY